jgi:PD-(D/E)XK nuclease superfamily
MRRQLPVLSHSALSCFQRCPKEFEFAYVLRRRPARVGGERDLGAAVHAGLAVWWSNHELYLAVAEVSKSATTLGLSPYDAAKARAMVTGYHIRWGEPPRGVTVSHRWALDFSGALGDMRLKGEYDALVDTSSEKYVVEHKTTTADISTGSPYWSYVQSVDPQVTMYLAASGANHVLYDALVKPKISPLQATPKHAIKYTIPTRAEPVPRLYAGQRLVAETPEEFEARTIKHIATRPNEHYARQEVIRSVEEIERYLDEVVSTSQAIERAEDAALYPRHPGACRRFNTICDYAPVCQGHASISDSMYDKERL